MNKTDSSILSELKFARKYISLRGTSVAHHMAINSINALINNLNELFTTSEPNPLARAVMVQDGWLLNVPEDLFLPKDREFDALIPSGFDFKQLDEWSDRKRKAIDPINVNNTKIQKKDSVEPLADIEKRLTVHLDHELALLTQNDMNNKFSLDDEDFSDDVKYNHTGVVKHYDVQKIISPTSEPFTVVSINDHADNDEDCPFKFTLESPMPIVHSTLHSNSGRYATESQSLFAKQQIAISKGKRTNTDLKFSDVLIVDQNAFARDQELILANIKQVENDRIVALNLVKDNLKKKQSYPFNRVNTGLTIESPSNFQYINASKGLPITTPNPKNNIKNKDAPKTLPIVQRRKENNDSDYKPYSVRPNSDK